MYLKKGKFVTGWGPDEKEIKPEFGNMEQIKLIHAYERRADAFTLGHKSVVAFETKLVACVEFLCVCGQEVSKDGDADTHGDMDSIVGGIKCPRCGEAYKIMQKDRTTVEIKFWES